MGRMASQGIAISECVAVNMARYIAVAPRNVSTGVQNLDFEP